MFLTGLFAMFVFTELSFKFSQGCPFLQRDGSLQKLVLLPYQSAFPLQSMPTNELLESIFLYSLGQKEACEFVHTSP